MYLIVFLFKCITIPALFLIDQQEIQSLGRNVRLRQNVLFFSCTAKFEGSFSKLKEKILFFGNRVIEETENKQETVGVSARMTACACNVCLRDAGGHL